MAGRGGRDPKTNGAGTAQEAGQSERRARMISATQVQERRLDELLRRQLGPQILAAIADPEITEIIINEDGRVWFESYGKGMHEADLSIAASQVESLIGT